jgi:hypothetical protein
MVTVPKNVSLSSSIHGGKIPEPNILSESQTWMVTLVFDELNHRAGHVHNLVEIVVVTVRSSTSDITISTVIVSSNTACQDHLYCLTIK